MRTVAAFVAALAMIAAPVAEAQSRGRSRIPRGRLHRRTQANAPAHRLMEQHVPTGLRMGTTTPRRDPPHPLPDQTAVRPNRATTAPAPAATITVRPNRATTAPGIQSGRMTTVPADRDMEAIGRLSMRVLRGYHTAIATRCLSSARTTARCPLRRGTVIMPALLSEPFSVWRSALLSTFLSGL